MRAVEEYKRKIYGIRDLPTLPAIAQKILFLADDDDAGAEELCQVISSDPALSVKILSVANSAYYGQRARIGTIQEAVLLIGTQMLKQLSLGVMVVDAFGGSGHKRAEFWRHCLVVASGAAVIARNTGARSPDLCFMGGLLHDIGRLIIEAYPPDHGDEILDSTEVGTWMAERWQLPLELVETIARCRRPARASSAHAPIVACVHLAEACSHMDAPGDVAEPHLNYDPEALAILSLTPERLLELAAELRTRAARFEQFFF